MSAFRSKADARNKKIQIVVPDVRFPPLSGRREHHLIRSVIKNDRSAFNRHAASRRIGGGARSRLPAVIMSNP